jgi:gamma-glutamyl-gamma-aminobutyrate hydrolase PuuD
MSTKGKRKIRTANKRAKKTTTKGLSGLIPLSSEEINKKIEDNRQMQLPTQLPAISHNDTAPLDLLGRKKSDYAQTRRVTVLEDSSIPYPELWLTVYIHGPEAGFNFNKMFARAKCYKANLPDDADLVVFTGSSHDIDPQLYGQPPHKSVTLNPALDKANLSLFSFCKNRGIPMFGVCGGAQLLHVANGGALYQDVDGHNSGHTMWDIRNKEFIQSVSSVHHQMCIPNTDMEILGTSHAAKERWLNPLECVRGSRADVEAFFYRETMCLGVQGHPEYAGYNKYTVWCLREIDRMCNENPDLSYRVNDAGVNHLRINEDLLQKRQSETITIPSEDVIIVEPIKE